jgi:Sap, sulfolipid-1-addressing protein
MYGQAAGLAALAALSPAALVLVAVYLGSARPGKHAGFFLAGALLMSIIMGVVVLAALRAGGLSVPSHQQPRYGLRLGLGVIALAAGAFFARRYRRPASHVPAKPKKQGIVSRMASRPRPLTAFATGVLVFAPSVGFIAAVQVIATSHSSDAAEAGALALVVIINVAFVWLPFAVYLIAPDRTVHALKTASAWLGSHGPVLLAGSLTAIGAILVIDGIAGLA